MLGPVGDIISQWTILGRFSSVSFGELDYSSSDPAEIRINMCVNEATLDF